MSDHHDALLRKIQAVVDHEREAYLMNIDPELRQKLVKIPVHVQLGDRTKYGDFSGTPMAFETRGGFSYATDIIIYALPFEPLLRSETALREKIRKVLVHEYGHYLGFNDGDLHERGVY